MGCRSGGLRQNRLKPKERLAISEGGIICKGIAYGMAYACADDGDISDGRIINVRQKIKDPEIDDSSSTFEYSLFCILDGHSGTVTRDFIQQHFGDLIRTKLRMSLAFEEYKNVEAIVSDVLEKSILQLDQDLFRSQVVLDGCTIIACLISADNIHIANVGHSRALFARDDVIYNTRSHRPTNRIETERIQKAGGFVAKGKLNGVLPVSRSIGDFYYKMNVNPDLCGVIAKPDIYHYKIEPRDRYMIIATDSVFAKMASYDVDSHIQEVINDVLDMQEDEGLDQSEFNTRLCEKFILKCMENKHGREDMSAVIITFPELFRSRKKPERPRHMVNIGLPL